MRQTLACVGDKVESAVLIGEGFMPDGLQQKVAAAHQALHLIFLLQDQSKLLLHVSTPFYWAARYNTRLLIKVMPEDVAFSVLFYIPVYYLFIYGVGPHSVPLILGGLGVLGARGGHEKLMARGDHLKHVSILESSTASCLHPHLRLLALPVVWAVVQVLGLDEIQALPNLGGLKLDKVQVACGRCTHLFTSACLA